MPNFAYEAISAKGQRIQGQNDAASREALIATLISQGLQPVSVKKLRPIEGILSDLLARRSRFSHEALLAFTRELADLLGAGVPLERSLVVIADSAEDARTKALVTGLLQAIQGGKSLSEALSDHPEIFGRLYVNMVTVGELGGVLPKVLSRLGGFLERSREIRNFIVTSSIYPSILAVVGILSIFVLVTFVVPKFGQIFEDLNQPMPLPTQMIVSFSDFAKSWWWVLVLAGGAGFIAFSSFLKTRDGKTRWDRFVLRIPFAGPMILRIELGRLCRTLGTLLESGVPILKGISLAREVVSNTVIRESLDEIYKGVRQGQSLSGLMKRGRIYPPLIVNLVSIGEETGAMDAMLLKIADDLDARIQHDTKVYLSLVEPLTIVVMGLVIGGIILSMLLAVFGINDVAL